MQAETTLFDTNVQVIEQLKQKYGFTYYINKYLECNAFAEYDPQKKHLRINIWLVKTATTLSSLLRKIIY